MYEFFLFINTDKKILLLREVYVFLVNVYLVGYFYRRYTYQTGLNFGDKLPLFAS